MKKLKLVVSVEEEPLTLPHCPSNDGYSPEPMGEQWAALEGDPHLFQGGEEVSSKSNLHPRFTGRGALYKNYQDLSKFKDIGLVQARGCSESSYSLG